VSRGALALGLFSSDTTGIALLGYEGGNEELFFTGQGGATTSGDGLLTAGVGMDVPWLRLGGARFGLGLEIAGTLVQRPTTLALGGGSFVEVDTPRFAGAARAYARLDLLATHPVSGGTLGATLVGSVGVALGK
jgi:hypothetical protein